MRVPMYHHDWDVKNPCWTPAVFFSENVWSTKVYVYMEHEKKHCVYHEKMKKVAFSIISTRHAFFEKKQNSEIRAARTHVEHDCMYWSTQHGPNVSWFSMFPNCAVHVCFLRCSASLPSSRRFHSEGRSAKRLLTMPVQRTLPQRLRLESLTRQIQPPPYFQESVMG